MADPVTLGILALTAASTGMGVVSSIQQGNAQAAAYKANANLAQMQADQTRQSGAYDADKLAREKEQTLSRQRALYAKSGVLFEGSPLEVMADSASQYEMDINALKYNTESKARQSEYQSSINRMQAKSAKTAGYMKAGTTLLTGATSMLGTMPKKK